MFSSVVDVLTTFRLFFLFQEAQEIRVMQGQAMASDDQKIARF